MLTDAEKSALERAAARLSLALRKSNVPRGIADLATLRGLIERAGQEGCPRCSGDCGSANPPVTDCPMRPTPPTDAKGDV